MTPATTVGEAGEHALLARLRQKVAPAPAHVPVAIGDDAAIVEPERNAADVLTCDAIIDGVHFDRALSPPRDIGHRALAVNLSDVAAMGATPRAALLSMGLPPDLPVEDFDGMLDGLLALAAEHRTALVGGNLSRTSGPLFLDVTIVGSVRPRRALLRHTARAGDALFVSGEIGAAAAGLEWLRRGTSEPEQPGVDDAVARYRAPIPRVRLGVLVGRSRAASACMDTSDGLGDAVAQLAAASGLGAEIDASALPLHRAVPAVGRHADAALELALRSDDYELLFAVPRRSLRAFRAAADRARVSVTRIGVLGRVQALVLRTADGERPWPSGYAHFSR